MGEGGVGIDFKGHDSYVVAPPSRGYEFLNNHEVLTLTYEQWTKIRDYLVESFNLKLVKDSGAGLTDEKLVNDYFTLKNGWRIPRISYKDTIELINHVLGLNLNPSGNSVAVRCLLHPERHKNGDKTPSAGFYKSKRGHGLYKCQVCDKTSHDVYDILKRLCNLDFMDVLNLLSWIAPGKYKAQPPEGEELDKNENDITERLTKSEAEFLKFLVNKTNSGIIEEPLRDIAAELGISAPAVLKKLKALANKNVIIYQGGHGRVASRIIINRLTKGKPEVNKTHEVTKNTVPTPPTLVL